MRKKTLRNFLSFLLVLVCTVTAVAALHLVTRAQAPASPRWRKPSQRRSFPPPSLRSWWPRRWFAWALSWVCWPLWPLAWLSTAGRSAAGSAPGRGGAATSPGRTWRSPAETEYKGFRPFIFYLGTGPATSAGPVFAQNKSRRESSTAACFLCFTGGKSGQPAAPHSPGWAKCRPPPPRGSVTWPARPPPRGPPAGR